MNLKKALPFLTLLGIAFLLYVIHKMVFYGFNINQETFHYSLETLYLFFFVLSVDYFQSFINNKRKEVLTMSECLSFWQQV